MGITNTFGEVNYFAQGYNMAARLRIGPPTTRPQGIFGQTEKFLQVSRANRLATSMPYGESVDIKRIWWN